MKISLWIAGGLMAAATLSASAQTMTSNAPYSPSDAGKPVAPAVALDALLSLFEQQVMAAANAMPEDKFDFTPLPGTFAPGSAAHFNSVRSFAQQLDHIASSNYWFYKGVGPNPVPADANSQRDLRKKYDVIRALGESFAYAHQQIATITPQNAFTAYEGVDGMHTRATVAAFNVAHGYDHYGQLVEYLRMNGIIPPGSK